MSKRFVDLMYIMIINFNNKLLITSNNARSLTF